MSVAQVDALIRSVLRDEAALWPNSSNVDFKEIIVRRCKYHGVTALLYQKLGRDPGWPRAVLEELREISVDQAMQELRDQQVLRRLLEQFKKSNVSPILFKGTALAYDIYANPVCRYRSDSDIIVSEGHLASCRNVLLSEGFERDIALPGEFVSHEENWRLGDGRSIDLHRKIHNSHLLSRHFTYEELYNKARPLPTLCPGALATDRVHALLIACMHRAAHRHHYRGDRLIWLYDLQLLAMRLDHAEWDEFLDMARRKDLGPICLEGLNLAASHFATHFPERIRVKLSECRTDVRTVAYLRGSSAYQLWVDFCEIEGFRKKLQFVRETVFPPSAYMRWNYPDARFSWLPWLYARRAFGGIGKRMIATRGRDLAHSAILPGPLGALARAVRAGGAGDRQPRQW